MNELEQINLQDLERDCLEVLAGIRHIDWSLSVLVFVIFHHPHC